MLKYIHRNYLKVKMKKMSTVYEMNRDTGLVFDKVRPENQWVVDGEGVATIKKDGTSSAVINGKLYKRFDKKLNKKGYLLSKKQKGDFKPTPDMFRVLPEGAIPCMETFDPVTFHFPHWIPVGDAPEDAFHMEAWNKQPNLEDGTYELVGPKIGGNPHKFTEHVLLKHGTETVDVPDRSFEGLKAFVIAQVEEGLVFHHTDGRMAKIRRGDFNKNQSDEWHWSTATPEDFN